MNKKANNCHSSIVVKNTNGSISIRKASPLTKCGLGNTKVAWKRKNSTNSKLEIKSEISKGRIILELPLRTKSEANCFEHWRFKHERHRKQRSLVSMAFKPVKDFIQLPCKILLTRLAPKKLDAHDNLPMSFKYIVDACCAIITQNFAAGQADSDERISIAYDQIQRKEYGIRIEVTF